MRKFTWMALVTICLAINACCSSKKSTSNQTAMETRNEIVNKKWQLIELNGKAVAESINGKMPFIEFHENDNRYSASAGCNGMGGEFTLGANGRITFSRGMSTMMACPNMEIEDQLGKLFEMVDNYTLKDGELALNKARMAPLARFKEVTTPSLNGTWEVDYIGAQAEGLEQLFPNKKPSITFNLPEMKATGNGGCNNFNVAFTSQGSDINFEMPASTRMACPGNGEAVFFSTLQKISKYSVSDNTLNLIMGDIAVMRLKRK